MISKHSFEIRREERGARRDTIAFLQNYLCEVDAGERAAVEGESFDLFDRHFRKKSNASRFALCADRASGGEGLVRTLQRVETGDQHRLRGSAFQHLGKLARKLVEDVDGRAFFK